MEPRGHAFPPDAPEGSRNPHRRLQRVPEQRDLDVDQMSVELADAYNTGLQAFLEHGNEGRGKESEATSLEGSLSRSEESLSGSEGSPSWHRKGKRPTRHNPTRQAAGGLSFVANAYNTGMQAFLEHGSEGRGKESEATSLEQFQKCILERHEVSKNSKSRKHDDIDD